MAIRGTPYQLPWPICHSSSTTQAAKPTNSPPSTRPRPQVHPAIIKLNNCQRRGGRREKNHHQPHRGNPRRIPVTSQEAHGRGRARQTDDGRDAFHLFFRGALLLPHFLLGGRRSQGCLLSFTGSKRPRPPPIARSGATRPSNEATCAKPRNASVIASPQPQSQRAEGAESRDRGPN